MHALSSISPPSAASQASLHNSTPQRSSKSNPKLKIIPTNTATEPNTQIPVHKLPSVPPPFLYAGEVHDCLREHRSALSKDCAVEEGKLEVLQASNVELQPGLARDCAGEREEYCSEVEPGQGRVYDCLIANGRLVRTRDTNRAKLCLLCAKTKQQILLQIVFLRCQVENVVKIEVVICFWLPDPCCIPC